MSDVKPRVTRRRAVIATLLMACGSAAGWQLTPRTPLASVHGELDLEKAVPKAFGDWQMDSGALAGVVNPQQEALLRQLYSQLVTRTYISREGQRVMVAIAYGNDQRDGMQMHYPEVCYPAQGFQVRSNRAVELDIAGRKVPGRRLETVLGNQRFEPVTYWTVIGKTAVRGGLSKKVVEMRYGFRDLIPDGLLFRVSTIDRNSGRAFAVQQAFANEMMQAVAQGPRSRLMGEG
jgi:EpsI family protein